MQRYGGLPRDLFASAGSFCPVRQPVQSATPLLPVNPDVPLVDALAHSANLQLIANQLMTDAAMGDDGPHLAWAAAYLGEMAQAIVHDLTIPVAYSNAG